MTRTQFLQLVVCDGECWLWQGSRRGLYGQCNDRDEPSRYAHRLSFRLWKGPIPDGLDVLHTCDNTLCVRPKHLWTGTKKQNQQDAVRKGRHKRTEQFKKIARERRLAAWRAGTYTHLITRKRKRKRITDAYL